MIRIGISGYGGTGATQAACFSTIPGCRVVAVYDPNPGGRERAANALRGVLFAHTFDQLLEQGIDAVAVCSPFPVHARQVVAALGAGKHVLCEQPLAGTLADCRQILNAAERSPECSVGIQRTMRFVPLHIKMRNVLDAGRLGRLSYVEANSLQNATRRLGLHDPWAMNLAPSPLLLAGCQTVDLLQWLLRDEVCAVSGMGSNTAFPEYAERDLCVALLRFRSGTIARVAVAFAAGRSQDHSLRMTGSDRAIEGNLLLDKLGGFQVLARPLLRHRRSETHSIKRRVGAWVRDVRWNAAGLAGHCLFALFRRLNWAGSPYPVQAYPLRLYEHGVAAKASVAAFVEGLRQKDRSRRSLFQAARTVAACLAGLEAIESGNTVEVPNAWPAYSSNWSMAAADEPAIAVSA